MCVACDAFRSRTQRGYPNVVAHSRASTATLAKLLRLLFTIVFTGRYQILEYLGSAAFSKAVQCLDLHTGQMVCIKIIKNNKDFFDQSLDEIKLLKVRFSAMLPPL